MAGISILANMGTGTRWICISPYSIEKVGDFLYPYTCPINGGFFVKTGTGLDNIHGRVYLLSLPLMVS